MGHLSCCFWTSSCSFVGDTVLARSAGCVHAGADSRIWRFPLPGRPGSCYSSHVNPTKKARVQTGSWGTWERRQMMTHEDAFLQDILENREDDTPRRIFADWLLDQFDPVRV